MFWRFVLVTCLSVYLFGLRRILHGSGRVPKGWPDLVFLIFELQISEIYQFVCTLGVKSDGVVKLTYGHDPWCKKDPPWIRKGFWRINRSIFVNNWATEKCHKSICLYFVRKFQWCDKITYGHDPWMAYCDIRTSANFGEPL